MNDAVVTLVEIICGLRERLQAAVAEIERLKKEIADASGDGKEAEHGL